MKATLMRGELDPMVEGDGEYIGSILGVRIS